MIPFLFDILWWYDGIKRSKVKGIYVYISCLNYLLFPYCYSITFWHTLMILHTCVSYEQRRTSIDLWVKRLRLTWKVWICCRGGGGGWCHIKHVHFKCVWVGSRVNDMYVYTLSAPVYSLHHDQTVLKRTLSVKVRTYKEWRISNIFFKVVSGKCGTQWRI